MSDANPVKVKKN